MDKDEKDVQDATKNILRILKEEDQPAKHIFRESPLFKRLKEQNKEVK